MRVIQNTNVCREKDCHLKGQPQPIENFHKGFTRCKVCMKIYNKKYKTENRDAIRKQENEAYYKNENIKNSHKDYRNRLANYNQFNERLSKYEETQKDPDNSDLIQVKCMHCKNWFTPRTTDCQNRLLCINSEFKNGESRFYCSDDCKKSCPIFWTITRERSSDNKTIRNKDLDRPLQKELREMVLERDEYTCVKCGSKETPLVCHHIIGVAQNPIESADIDNCITICKKCDKQIHSEPGCKPVDLRCKM